MLNTDKLNLVKNEIEEGLQEKFPAAGITLSPYYCGMGYCGVEIMIENELNDVDIVEQYYKEHYARKFFDYKITKKSDKTDEYKPSEVRIMGKNNTFNPCPEEQ